MTADSEVSFTAHNVRLDDGTETLPSMGFTMDLHPITRSVKRLLTVLYPDGLAGKTIIDVGCLEGGFATEFARIGLHATGVEVRDSNYQNCLYVRERVDLPNLTFLQGNANDIAQYGQFDVHFVSGLLYHLDNPRKFLEDVARNCRKALILWTHVTQAEPNEASKTYNLSALTENEGLHGRWYPEHDELPEDRLEKLKWASWENPRSFWIQKEYLLHLLREIGFDLVFEQFDCLDSIVDEMMDGFYHKIDRVTLVAVKSGLPPEQYEKLASRPIPASAEAHRAESPGDSSDAAQLRAAAAERELSQARAALEVVYASSSWRVTAPLRQIGRLLRRHGQPAA